MWHQEKKMKAAVQTELTHIQFYSATVISEGIKCEASLTVEAVDDATFFNFDDHNISICQNTTESAAVIFLVFHFFSLYPSDKFTDRMHQR